MSDPVEFVHKVTLGSGKVVMLRDPVISDQEIAAQAVGDKAGDNKFVFVTMMSKEMVKLLIHSIDGKKLSANERQLIDKYLTFKEYSQISQVVSKLTSMGDEAAPLIETVSSGVN